METVLIHNTLKNELCVNFQQIVENQISAAQRELLQSFEELVQKLTRSSHEKIIMVYVAADREELSNLISIRKKLFNINLILILPDNKEMTVSQGYKLYPRFLTTLGYDVAEVAAILKKMIDNNL